VYVCIWDAKFPYFFAGGSVGHMAVFDFQDDDFVTLASQFPANGFPGGVNQTDSFSQTMDAEGRDADFVFLVGITNQSAMDAEAAKQQAYATWTVFGGSDSTQCTLAGVAVLQAGGVDIGNHWLPGFAGSNLVQLAGIPGSGVTQVFP
jgi:hypothetical protein